MAVLGSMGYDRRVLQHEAEAQLAGLSLHIALEGSVVRVRALLARCLDGDVPALVGPCPKSG